ncbi:MAG: hypothetical protein RLZZ505_3240 [Verrucomicrobiota bacterium]|jgi:hypothetical protein
MKNSYIKSIKLALGFLAALALPSCLQNETTLSLNKDGSGTVTEETYLGVKMLEMMAQFAQPGQPDPVEEMFSEEKAKAKAGKMGEGVEYVKTEMINKDGKKGAIVHYKFADINKLKVSPSGAVDDMTEQAAKPDDKENETVSFSYADGKLKVITPPTDFEDMNMDDAGAENAEMETMMKEMMADMRLTLKLKIADGIASTNATHTEGDTITLFDVEVGKMFAQKAELKKISETSKTDKEAAKAAFANLDGIKIETKENVTVTLK